jgi:hypothetical protein
LFKRLGPDVQELQATSTASPIVAGFAVNVDLISRVVEKGYAPDLTDDEVEKIGRDPFLIPML